MKVLALALIVLALTTAAVQATDAFSYSGYYPLGWQSGYGWLPYTGYGYFKWSYSHTVSNLEWYSPATPNSVATPPNYDFPQLASRYFTERDQRCLGANSTGAVTCTRQSPYTYTKEQCWHSELDAKFGVNKLANLGIGVSAAGSNSYEWTWEEASEDQCAYLVEWGRKATPFAKRHGYLNEYQGNLTAGIWSGYASDIQPGGELKGSASYSGNPVNAYVCSWTYSVATPLENWGTSIGCKLCAADARCNGHSCAGATCDHKSCQQ